MVSEIFSPINRMYMMENGKNLGVKDEAQVNMAEYLYSSSAVKSGYTRSRKNFFFE